MALADGSTHRGAQQPVRKRLPQKARNPSRRKTRFGSGRCWRLCRLPKIVVRQTQQQQEPGGKAVPTLTGWCCLFPSLQDHKLWSRAQIWRAPFFCRGSGVTRASDRLPCCPCRSLAFVLLVIFVKVIRHGGVRYAAPGKTA